MRSPAAAIAWELRRRHRWGLIALAAYLVVLAAIKRSVTFADEESFALMMAFPMTATFIYLLAVFSFGLAGDLAARQSMYPARMFTLPLRTGALAGWPMLYGTAAMAVLWLATRSLAAWPPGFDVPIIWPALLAASLLAWTQALTWMPYPLPGLRVIVTVLWLALIDSVILLALDYKASEAVMLAILAPHVPLAYLAARFAVGRARRGEVPDWRGSFAGLGKLADFVPRRRGNFRSPARAQAWLEWRRLGRSLPALVAIVLPFELALLFVFRETPGIVYEILFGVLLTPPFMAAFTAATVRKSSPAGGDSHGVTPFLATRPLTSASLVAAKLKATIRSTLAAWLLVVVVTPLGLRLSGTLPLVIERWGRLVEVVETPRAAAIVLLGLFALMASTWKQLVQSLYIGLSGREWVVKASVFLTLLLLGVFVPLARWVLTSRYVMAVLWRASLSIAAVLVCIKLSAAIWIAARLHGRRLLSGRAIVAGAACWDAFVFALYALLAWIVPALLVRRSLLVLIAILAVPLARLSAAPLALARNRHR